MTFSSRLASQTREKNIVIFQNVSCYGFSQGWKSLYNTVDYIKMLLNGDKTEVLMIGFK